MLEGYQKKSTSQKESKALWLQGSPGMMVAQEEVSKPSNCLFLFTSGNQSFVYFLLQENHKTTYSCNFSESFQLKGACKSSPDTQAQGATLCMYRCTSHMLPLCLFASVQMGLSGLGEKLCHRGCVKQQDKEDSLGWRQGGLSTGRRWPLGSRVIYKRRRKGKGGALQVFSFSWQHELLLSRNGDIDWKHIDFRMSIQREKHFYIALNRSLHSGGIFQGKERYNFTQVYDKGLDREQKNVKWQTIFTTGIERCDYKSQYCGEEQ